MARQQSESRAEARVPRMGSGGSRALLRHSWKSQEPRRGWGTAREADDPGREGHQGEGTAYHSYRNPRRPERTQTHNQDLSRNR